MGTTPFTDVVGATVAALVLLGLVTGAGAVVCRPWLRGAPHLAFVYGWGIAGLSALVVFFTWVLSPPIGQGLGAAILVVAVLVLGIAVATSPSGMVSMGRRAAAPAVVALGLLAVVLGLFALWSLPADSFGLARERFTHPMPPDNEIPAIVAGRLLGGQDPRSPISGDWLSSDRPPLQTGFQLLVVRPADWVGIPPSTALFATGVVVQMSWVPAVYAICRAVSFTRRSSLIAVVFTGLSGTVLVNTVYTWPKLLSSAYVLGAVAVALWIPHRPRSAVGPLAMTAVLTVLGLLSHGTAVFAVPIIGWALWRARPALGVGALLAGGTVALATYAPWLAYQRFYDPPGDRLLKWHFAGVIAINDNSFGHDLARAYSQTPVPTLLEYKLLNLLTPLGARGWDFTRRWGFPTTTGLRFELREWQFFTVTGALSLAMLPLAAMVASGLAQRVRRAGGASTIAQPVTGLLVTSVVSLVLWCLVLYLPESTVMQHGSHAPILLLSCLPVAWLASRRPMVAGALCLAQTGLLVGLYLSGPQFLSALPVPRLARRPAVAVLVGLVAMALGTWWAGRRDHEAGSQNTGHSNGRNDRC